MEKTASFDLDCALHNWRTQLVTSSSVNRENIDELEIHLRESVARLCAVGLSQEEAWLIAQKRFGETHVVRKEFEKVRPVAQGRGISEKQFIVALLACFAFVTAVLVYFDPPVDFMHWMDGYEDFSVRTYLLETFGFALPSVHDFKIACLAVLAFLAGVTLLIVLRDKNKSLRIPGKTEPHST